MSLQVACSKQAMILCRLKAPSTDCMYISYLDYCGREMVFKRQLGTWWDSCCFIIRHYVDVYPFSPLKRSGLFISVEDRWRTYERSSLLLVQIPIILAYYSNMIMSHRAPKLVFVLQFLSTVLLFLFPFFFQPSSVALLVSVVILLKLRIWLRGR